MDKLKGGELSKCYIKDELDYLLEIYTPEQISLMMGKAVPKFSNNKFKIPIIYGTGEMQ